MLSKGGCLSKGGYMLHELHLVWPSIVVAKAYTARFLDQTITLHKYYTALDVIISHVYCTAVYITQQIYTV